MCLVARKPVFGVSDNAMLKPVSSASETSYNIEISLEASLDIILPRNRITKALISLRGCTGWSAPLLFASPPKTVFLASWPIYCRRLNPCPAEPGFIFFENIVDQDQLASDEAI